MYLAEVEQTIWHSFISAITGEHIVNDDERILSPRLEIKILTETASFKFTNSMNLTMKLQNEIKRITNQKKKSETRAAEKTIQQVKGDQSTNFNIQLSAIKEKMTHEQIQQRDWCVKSAYFITSNRPRIPLKQTTILGHDQNPIWLVTIKIVICLCLWQKIQYSTSSHMQERRF